MRIGLIGLGAIGQGLLRLLQQHPQDGIVVVGALVRDLSRPRASGHPTLVDSAARLLALQPEVVVEMGGHEALEAHAPHILEAGCDMILVSVGALADPALEERVVRAARQGRSNVVIASGAIGGLDAIASAAVGGLERVTHTTRKPARALLPPDEAASLTEPRELFQGFAREAVKRFPESINVVAAVSLAGLGLDRTAVRVIADPALTRNQHEVVAEGTFGKLRFEISNIPSDENPKTGRIVAMSVLHTLRMRQSAVRVG